MAERRFSGALSNLLANYVKKFYSINSNFRLSSRVSDTQTKQNPSIPNADTFPGVLPTNHEAVHI